MFEKIDSHFEVAKERQVQVFRDKENINKKLEIYAERIQSLEDVLYDLLLKRGISTAEGVQLDRAGEVFGDSGSRSGKTDEEYRAFLKTYPFKLREAGQHDVLVKAYKQLTNAIKVKHLKMYPRATMFIAVVDNFDDVENKESIKQEIDEIRAQGVLIELAYELKTGAFTLSSNEDGDVEEGTGFSDVAVGGNGGTINYLT